MGPRQAPRRPKAVGVPRTFRRSRKFAARRRRDAAKPLVNNIHIVIAGSLDNAHLASRNPENASASGGKPLTPSPPHVTNNGKHVQIIKILDFMQILCHRKDRKVGKEIKMLGRGVGRILSWVGEYTPLCYYLVRSQMSMKTFIFACWIITNFSIFLSSDRQRM